MLKFLGIEVLDLGFRQYRGIVPLKQIEYYNKISVYPIFYLLKGTINYIEVHLESALAPSQKLESQIDKQIESEMDSESLLEKGCRLRKPVAKKG